MAFFKHLFSRIGVHCLALLASAFFTEEGGGSIVAAYIGLICLFPYGDMKEKEWLVPVIAGALQAFLLFLAGWPLSAGIFIGGMLTWCSRFLTAKGKIGWEWSVLPMFLIVLKFYLIDEIIPGMNAMSLLFLISFGVMLFLGWLVLQKRRRLARVQDVQKMLEQGKLLLQNAASRHSLPGELQQQSEMLLKQVSTYARWGEKGAETPFPLAPRILATARAVDEIGRKAALTAEAEKNSDISRWINSARRLNRHQPQGASKEEVLLKDCQSLTAILLEKNRVAQPSAAGENDYAEYEKSAQDLLKKKNSLPAELAVHAEQIAYSTFSIIQSMTDDPADRLPGKRFLDKYLPITHRILDEHMRLSGLNNKSEEIRNSLGKSQDMMERLSRAFADEHSSLLQNDAMNFTAELNALDAVLKMQGH